MLTMSEDHDTALDRPARRRGGLPREGADPERLEHALRAAAGGDVVLDHDMACAVTELAPARTDRQPSFGAHAGEFDILDPWPRASTTRRSPGAWC